MINIRKHIINDNKTMHTPTKQISNTSIKRRQHSSIENEHHHIKQQRCSTTISPKINIKQNNEDNEIIRLKNANDLLIREVQSLISTPTQSIQNINHHDIIHLQNEYEHLNTQMINIRNEQIEDNRNAILNKLKNDVENLLQQIKNLQEKNSKQPKKTFADELFEKYTIEYILSLNENDIQQRFEQLEKENQLLLLIKQVR